MTEYSDKWLEEISSDFIVRTCQLLPEFPDYAHDRCHIPTQSLSCLPITYRALCGSGQEFYIRPVNQCIDDMDMLLYQLDRLAFVDDIPVLPNDVSDLADAVECLRIEPCFGYPGFIRLRLMGTMIYNWKSHQYCFNRNTSFPARYHRLDTSDFEADLFSSDELLDEPQTTRIGPAIRVKTIKPAKYDLVDSVWCPYWPKEGEDWITRCRDCGWPTMDSIEEVLQQGCHVVYVQHRDCGIDQQQWRFSFSMAEVILIQSWTDIQQIVYHLLRCFAKQELIPENCAKEDEVFCTYHLKTMMLWTCEKMSPKFWSSCSIIAICCELLKTASRVSSETIFSKLFYP